MAALSPQSEVFVFFFLHPAVNFENVNSLKGGGDFLHREMWFFSFLNFSLKFEMSSGDCLGALHAALLWVVETDGREINIKSPY